MRREDPMTRFGQTASTLLALALLGGCCGFLSSEEARYEKYLECAGRITDLKSIEILAKGNFCCEPLPSGIQSLPEARRFYLEKARVLRPEAAEPLLGLGRAYWEEGSYAEAQTRFQAAAPLLEKPIYAEIAAVTMMRLQGRFDEGRALAEKIRTEKGVDGEKVAEYLLGRLDFDAGQLLPARVHFEVALGRAERGDYGLGGTPFTMRDAHFYLALIKHRGGDPQAAYRDFLVFLKKMSDPEFQIFYAYWLPRLQDDQGALFEKIEGDWTRVRQ
jgi:tetratricopeptide (TPR) repeat protein